MKKNISSFLILLLCAVYSCENKSGIIIKEDQYTVYNNKVEQGEFKAEALSPTEIHSTYTSPMETYSPDMEFKFSINSRDNEMPAGKNHRLRISPYNGQYTSPIIEFGKQMYDSLAAQGDEPLAPNTTWKIRVDASKLMDEFREKGFYTTPTGDVIFKEDFKGIYIAGSGAPLTWDFENLYGKSEMQLTDEDNDGIYETTITLNKQKNEIKHSHNWKLTGDISKYPQYESKQVLIDALYNMALEDLTTNIRPDGTLRAGAEWDGVWTRDISYSIYLSLAYLEPEVARKSLEAKVKNNRIVQDTGTGGAWPVSSDRVVWSIAAWELYKYTGDKDWLSYAYRIIQNTAQDDWQIVYDKQTGLMRGEQSYLDWREQSYPRWMQPIDIYQSLCLSTNAVHFQMYDILTQMANTLNENAEPFAQKAEKLKSAILKHLWNNEKGYFGQYLYGENFPILSPSSETLGESLSILFGIASPEQSSRIISNMPVTPFGTSCIFPQIPNIKPYHNNAVWPFVQSFYNLAAAKTGNEKAALYGLGSLYRAAALFGTNQELFVASSGDYKGTAVNSGKMLWSLSGNIAMIYRLYFGIEFETDGISFHPFIPRSISGEKTIRNFKYRQATLNLSINGTGNVIKKIKLDGKELDKPFIPATLIGQHSVSIELDNTVPPQSNINKQPVLYMPETVSVSYSAAGHKLIVNNYDSSYRYSLYLNGIKTADFERKEYNLPSFKELTQIVVTATDKDGNESFSNKPLIFLKPTDEWFIEAENIVHASTLPYKGYTGKGFIEINKSEHVNIGFSVAVPEEGQYLIDVRYANGNGPINTQNKCAIRTLFVDNQTVGALVMPQRGENEWSNWGYSNAINIYLKKGENRISIRFIEPQDDNMNGEINSALIDFIRLRKIR